MAFHNNDFFGFRNNSNNNVNQSKTDNLFDNFFQPVGNFNIEDLTFKPTKYYNYKEDQQLVVFDSRFVTNGTSASFTYENVKFDLEEKLHITKDTDVYLEFFSFNNTQVGSHDNLANKVTSFILDIPELKIQNYTNNEFIEDKYILQNNQGCIPETNYDTSDADVNTMYIEPNQRYITTLTPTILETFSISIYGQEYDSGISEYKYIYR